MKAGICMSENLGIKIKALRKSLNLTLEEFGKLIYNTSKSNVHKWENNNTKPSMKNLNRIAELANKSLKEFLNEETYELSIFEANHKLDELGYYENKIKNIEDILHEYKDLTEDELNQECKLVSLKKKVTYKEYKFELIEELNKLKNDYVTELKNLVELQNKMLNSEITKEIVQNDTIPLETLFNSSYTFKINETCLTAEDKKRALEILKLIFK